MKHSYLLRNLATPIHMCVPLHFTLNDVIEHIKLPETKEKFKRLISISTNKQEMLSKEELSFIRENILQYGRKLLDNLQVSMAMGEIGFPGFISSTGPEGNIGWLTE